MNFKNMGLFLLVPLLATMSILSMEPSESSDEDKLSLQQQLEQFRKEQAAKFARQQEEAQKEAERKQRKHKKKQAARFARQQEEAIDEQDTVEEKDGKSEETEKTSLTTQERKLEAKKIVKRLLEAARGKEEEIDLTTEDARKQFFAQALKKMEKAQQKKEQEKAQQEESENQHTQSLTAKPSCSLKPGYEYALNQLEVYDDFKKFWEENNYQDPEDALVYFIYRIARDMKISSDHFRSTLKSIFAHKDAKIIAQIYSIAFLLWPCSFPQGIELPIVTHFRRALLSHVPFITPLNNEWEAHPAIDLITAIKWNWATTYRTTTNVNMLSFILILINNWEKIGNFTEDDWSHAYSEYPIVTGNEAAPDGTTVFMFAVSNGLLGLVKKLIELGADPFAMNLYDDNALSLIDNIIAHEDHYEYSTDLRKTYKEIHRLLHNYASNYIQRIDASLSLLMQGQSVEENGVRIPGLPFEIAYQIVMGDRSQQEQQNILQYIPLPTLSERLAHMLRPWFLGAFLFFLHGGPFLDKLP
jgi:hypothetical protein